ncbi:pyrroloquinoline quinone biosynthesis protein PqqF [Pseudomonas sp. DOAB1067]|uniref:Coenzyme PQQ synthesis protein F n=1 Tax=Pseudomonas triticifolii TaxID=2762592 RepID=A0ABR7BFK2_9PSED|nr:pyrroloquinoline quinone biosynthesis protein PqqF [Pseudomonas triticifolii]
MPSPRTSAVKRITLANGLSVVLCNEPRLKRCAASLRVAAGSHDVPRAWPGLAHFLEHLFFLGTERFTDEQNLMTYVQCHGGQVNASTRERTTDFFFELPPAAFADGLERLCDMLAQPRMAMADQLREREVLHAEFIAWRGDAETRQQRHLLASINPHHPLRGFHAGNRYSLSVPNPAFQQALRDFYQRFYQAGQMTLCLSGPQSLAELESLATRYGVLFAAGKRVEQLPAPSLTEHATPVLETDAQRLHLLFACDGLPEKADEAVAFLCHWMNAAKPGGLVATLSERGLTDALKATQLYLFGGQLLLEVTFEKGFASKLSPAKAAGLSLHWLAFFKSKWSSLVEEYRRIQHRQLQVCGALALAHHYCRDLPTTLSEQGGEALRVLLDQLGPETLINVQGVDNPAGEPGDWHLPAPNPFLLTDSESRPAAVEAAVYLRWTLQHPQPRLWQVLNDSLKDLIEEARQAGVALAFSEYGTYWQLRLNGLHEPFAAIIKHCLHCLRHPAPEALARYAEPANEPALIPIRQLLKRLPDYFLASGSSQETDDLHSVWAGASWTRFATGLPTDARNRVEAALQGMPGKPQAQPAMSTTRNPGKHWQTEASSSSESAVLLFCPAPSASARDEAAWRLLAHRIQAPFYQRLRVELQLGYAVFSGIRQIDGTTGLLFGVQSPSCSVDQLVAHIEAFLEGLPELIRNADLAEQRQALITQQDVSTLPYEQAAETRWQAHLAGHTEGHGLDLHGALSNLDTHSLNTAARALCDASAGWLILANRPPAAAFKDRYLNGNGLS